MLSKLVSERTINVRSEPSFVCSEPSFVRLEPSFFHFDIRDIHTYSFLMTLWNRCQCALFLLTFRQKLGTHNLGSKRTYLGSKCTYFGFERTYKHLKHYRNKGK